MSRRNLSSVTGPHLLEDTPPTPLPRVGMRARSGAFLEVLREDFQDRGELAHKWKIADSDPGVLSNCRWSPGNVSLDRYGLRLAITPRPGPTWLSTLLGRENSEVNTNGTKAYRGAKISLRTSFVRTGTYEAQIRPARREGVVTSFILKGEGEQEITCCEFVGESKAQIGHALTEDRCTWSIVELPPCEEGGWYLVLVRWDRSSISWSINGTPIYQTTSEVPPGPLKPVFSLWSVEPDNLAAREWAGTFSYPGKPVVAHVRHCRVVI